MPNKQQHRGPHPEDHHLFADGQVPDLRAATHDLSWLLSKEYALTSSLKLVGDRYKLTARQRTAVSRSVCSQEHKTHRQSTQLSPENLVDQPLWIDGYNVLTSIEAALSGGVLLLGMDGCLRDMASMHGSYRKVAETIPAIHLIGRFLAASKIGPCRWLLDQPVSNSGRLRTLMQEIADAEDWKWEIELVPDPDPILIAANCCIATADSDILNQTASWLNLAQLIVSTEISRAWIVDLQVT